METQSRIINCHTHVFVHDVIPPYIAKSFMAWPLYRILTTDLILWIAKLFYADKPWSPFNEKNRYLYRRIQKAIYTYRAWVKRTPVINILVSLFNFLVILNATYFLFRTPISALLSFNQDLFQWANDLKNWLVRIHVLFPSMALGLRIVLIAFVFFFLKGGRKILIGIFKNTFKLASLWPDNKTIEFYKRYINIGR